MHEMRQYRCLTDMSPHLVREAMGPGQAINFSPRAGLLRVVRNCDRPIERKLERLPGLSWVDLPNKITVYASSSPHPRRKVAWARPYLPERGIRAGKTSTTTVALIGWRACHGARRMQAGNSQAGKRDWSCIGPRDRTLTRCIAPATCRSIRYSRLECPRAARKPDSLDHRFELVPALKSGSSRSPESSKPKHAFESPVASSLVNTLCSKFPWLSMGRRSIS